MADAADRDGGDFNIVISNVQINRLSLTGGRKVSLSSDDIKTIDGKLFFKLSTRRHSVQRLLTYRCNLAPRESFKALPCTTIVEHIRTAKLSALYKYISQGQSSRKKRRFSLKQFNGRNLTVPDAISVLLFNMYIYFCTCP